MSAALDNVILDLNARLKALMWDVDYHQKKMKATEAMIIDIKTTIADLELLKAEK